jgi:LuxR family transcriptional regulator, maltose regulon positive regulatory protein
VSVVQESLLESSVAQRSGAAASTDRDRVAPAVRIAALGAFHVHVGGHPVAVSRARSRPLELLKALLAAEGDGASRQRLVQWLWPAGEGDAFNTLEINVHRLRRLLGRRDALVAEEGRVKLNRAVCWIDLVELEAAMKRAEAAGRIDFASGWQVLMLYTGHFLEDQEEAHWTLVRRERLRQRLVSIVERCARTLDASADTEAAIDLFRLAVARDPINEVFNCGLMSALARAGRHDEALVVYKRLGRLLDSALGVKPSARTEALYVELARGARGR